MTTFLQLTVQGLALGCIYALIALGFTVVLMAGVINFAQGSFMLVGAYLVSWMVLQMQVPFLAALPIAVAGLALIGILFERLVLRRLTIRPVFVVIMLTISLDIFMRVLAVLVFGYEPRANGDPWELSGFTVGGVRVNWADIWTLITTLALLVIFFIFFKFSKYGIAMRAAAIDSEAAAIVGISLSQVYVITWIITGLVATLGGVFLAASPRVLDANLGFVAFRAFPAIILGGLGSTVGAVVGGLILGLVEVLASGYIGTAHNQYLGFLGNNFYTIASYIVLLLVLLLRPYGLFGKKEAERV
ncbi:MAG TPA: branched-chain amino acid ABC transporter permease [Chloroflexia bacterium]|nr:branched-chain amino acid ABC transporter permease [Chloroflexia bacterium]